MKLQGLRELYDLRDISGENRLIDRIELSDETLEILLNSEVALSSEGLSNIERFIGGLFFIEAAGDQLLITADLPEAEPVEEKSALEEKTSDLSGQEPSAEPEEQKEETFPDISDFSVEERILKLYSILGADEKVSANELCGRLEEIHKISASPTIVGNILSWAECTDIDYAMPSTYTRIEGDPLTKLKEVKEKLKEASRHVKGSQNTIDKAGLGRHQLTFNLYREMEDAGELLTEEKPAESIERKYYSELSQSKKKEIKDRVVQLSKEHKPMEISRIIRDEFPKANVNDGSIYNWKNEAELQTKAKINSAPTTPMPLQAPQITKPPKEEIGPEIKEEAQKLMKNDWTFKRIADFLNAKHGLSLSKQDIYGWKPKEEEPPTPPSPEEPPQPSTPSEAPENEGRQFCKLASKEKEEIVDRAKELLKTMKPAGAHRQIKREYPNLEISYSNFYKWNLIPGDEKESIPTAEPTPIALGEVGTPEFKEGFKERCKNRKKLRILQQINKKDFLLDGEVDPKERELIEELEMEELIRLDSINDEKCWTLTEQGFKMYESNKESS